MNPLMALQIMIAIEALRTLITLERTIILRRRLAWVMTIQRRAHVLLRILSHIHAADERHLAAWCVDVRHDRSGHRGQVVSTAVRGAVVASRGGHGGVWAVRGER